MVILVVGADGAPIRANTGHIFFDINSVAPTEF